MDLASLCRWYTLGSKGPQSIEIAGREPVVRSHLPPAESRANFQPGWATKRRTSVSNPASVPVRRRQVAWRHLGNPESKGRGRSSEVGDLHVQRGAKVLAGDKLPFIHLTELDIVNVRRVEAGPVVTARNAAFGGGRHEIIGGFYHPTTPC